jgi:hypothetical protein
MNSTWKPRLATRQGYRIHRCRKRGLGSGRFVAGAGRHGGLPLRGLRRGGPCGRAARKRASPWATRLVIARAEGPWQSRRQKTEDRGQSITGASRRNMTVFGPLSSGLPRRAARAMTEFSPSCRGEYLCCRTGAGMNKTPVTTRQTTNLCHCSGCATRRSLRRRDFLKRQSAFQVCFWAANLSGFGYGRYRVRKKASPTKRARRPRSRFSREPVERGRPACNANRRLAYRASFIAARGSLPP